MFQGQLPADIAQHFGYVKPAKEKPAPPPPPAFQPADGAVQVLGILQRDARLVDFLLEDISAYTDDQVGAAVRTMQEQARACLQRYVQLSPVIDGVEGAFVKLDLAAVESVKFVGNVPSGAPPKGGILRHRGWRVEKVELPQISPRQDRTLLAPAEIEVE